MAFKCFGIIKRGGRNRIGKQEIAEIGDGFFDGFEETTGFRFYRDGDAAAGARIWELERQLRHASVFEAPPYFVLDLARLQGRAVDASSHSEGAERAPGEEVAWPPD